MNNNEKFLSLYNDLDDCLRAYYHCNDRTCSVYVKAVNDLNKTGHSEYMKIAKKLNMIRVLRNNLIHELDMNSDNLIEITDETISFLEELLSYFRNPRTAKDMGTKIENIYCVKMDSTEPLNNIISVMKEKGYSQVPVVNHQYLLRGIFSPSVLFMYLADHPTDDINKLTLQDLTEYYPLDKHKFESYAFVKENEVEENVDNIFLDAYNTNKKLAMLFVTKSGSASEPIKAIIVLKDLLHKTNWCCCLEFSGATNKLSKQKLSLIWLRVISIYCSIHIIYL